MKNILLCVFFNILAVAVYAQGPEPVKTDTVWVKGLPVVFVKVESGTFEMGGTAEQSVAAASDEKPVHTVTLDAYKIAQTEVTQELWQTVMDNNPSTIKGSNRPVHNVSWYNCMEFIETLNALTGRTFRLPTEAEWEFAARGGNRSKGFRFAGSNNAEKVAWNAETLGGAELYFVNQRQPNELGIFDMSGNAYEWCSDVYGKYTDKQQSNPMGADFGENRVLRGGSWLAPRTKCRVSARNNSLPYNRNTDFGFRLVLEK